MDNVPRLILSATGTVLAQGTAATVSAQAFRLAAVMPKTHSYFLVAAGGVLAFATLAFLREHLAQMSGDRNAGLPSGLRAHSQRALARAADRDAADQLRNDEWSVHHLIGIQPAKQHLPLLTAATRAGWTMDEATNLMILPRNEAAQAKLAAMGIHRHVHDNGHPKWNREVNAELIRIERWLRSSRLPKESMECAILARNMLLHLQLQRRIEAIGKLKISQSDSIENPTNHKNSLDI